MHLFSEKLPASAALSYRVLSPVSSDFLHPVEPEIYEYLRDLLNSWRRIISGT